VTSLVSRSLARITEGEALFSLLSLLSLLAKREKREKANHLRKAREATPSMKRYLHFRSLAKREAGFTFGDATPLITFTASVIPFTLGNFLHFWCRFSRFSLLSLVTEGEAKRASRSASEKREGSKEITKSKGASEGGHLSWKMGRIEKEELIF
jgi:hypothetical protein